MSDKLGEVRREFREMELNLTEKHATKVCAVVVAQLRERLDAYDACPPEKTAAVLALADVLASAVETLEEVCKRERRLRRCPVRL